MSGASAVISECGTYRYELCRSWASDGSTLVAVMLNPSTADASQDDPTIRRLIAFAKGWGHVRLRVVNLFAYRSVDPHDLAASSDPVGPDNDRHIAAAAVDPEAQVLCAWGALGGIRSRNRAVMRLLVNAGRQHVHRFGLTKGGHPRHPLYMRKDAVPVVWNIGDAEGER